jgi:hypothetical protein
MTREHVRHIDNEGLRGWGWGSGILGFFWHFKRMIRGLEIWSAQRFQLIRRYWPSENTTCVQVALGDLKVAKVHQPKLSGPHVASEIVCV